MTQHSTIFIIPANTNEFVLQKAGDVMGVAPGNMPEAKICWKTVMSNWLGIFSDAKTLNF